MKNYREKIEHVLNSDQFKAINGAKDENAIKIAKQRINSLQQLMKQGNIVTKLIKELDQMI